MTYTTKICNNRLETIDSSLNYLHERIEEYLDKPVTIRKRMLDLSILLKQSRQKLELDETRHHKPKNDISKNIRY